MALQLFKIETVEVSSPVSSVTFSNIPQGYTDLMLVVSFRSSTEDVANNTWITFNGVGGTSYSARVLYTTGSTVTSGQENSLARTAQIFTNSSTSTNNTFGSMSIYIPNYATANLKSWSADYACENNATACHLGITAGLFNSAAAITSINLAPYSAAWGVNSTATLYGVL